MMGEFQSNLGTLGHAWVIPIYFCLNTDSYLSKCFVGWTTEQEDLILEGSGM